MSLVVTSPLRLLCRKTIDSIWNAIGWGLEFIHAPAKLKQFEFVDPETNETVYVYTDRLYSVLCVGPRRFYFDRVTGAYDGTSTFANNIARRVEFPD